jgi:hypothetical protein
MPWTPKQMRVIHAREHGWEPPAGGPFANVSPAKAHEMAGEGLRAPVKKKTARDAHNALKARMKK